MSACTWTLPILLSTAVLAMPDRATPGEEALLCDTVKPSRRPRDAPRCSDVGMRLFILQPEGIRSADNLIAAGKSFHITRAEWSYIMDKPFIERCRKLGWHFQGTMNAITNNADHAIKDRDGKPVLDHFNKPGRYMADPNNELYRRWYLERLKQWFALGVYAIQRDEPTGLGGLGGLRRWEYPDADRFFTLLHKQAEGAAGRAISWSCNLVWNQGGRLGGKGEAVTGHFGFGVSEVRAKSIHARFLWESARDARRRGKTIVYTGGHDLGIPRTRLAIAGCYAVGLTFIVPWDQFGGVGKKRIFAKPEDLADLYGFIRAVAPLLDGYEGAAAVHSGRDGNTAEAAPVRISGGSGEVTAVVRVKPGSQVAPVAVHLIDWAAKPERFEVHLDTKRFFGGEGLEVRMLSPVSYESGSHAAAEKAAAAMVKPGQMAGIRQATAYAAFRRASMPRTTVRDGWTSVKIPPIRPWGLLEITPTRQADRPDPPLNGQSRRRPRHALLADPQRELHMLPDHAVNGIKGACRSPES